LIAATKAVELPEAALVIRQERFFFVHKNASRFLLTQVHKSAKIAASIPATYSSSIVTHLSLPQPVRFSLSKKR